MCPDSASRAHPEGDEAAVRTAVHDGLLTVTLDRPQRANSLRRIDMIAIAEAFETAFDRGDVRAVFLCANGRHFCAGADIISSNEPGRPRSPHGAFLHGLAHYAHRTIAAIWECPLPTVSAVQGTAAGMGFNLALATDFIVAAPDARFSLPFTKIGFSVDSGASWLLPRLIGLSRARHLLLRAQPLTASDAAALGLVTLAPDADPEAAGVTLARELAQGPTFALGLIKGMANKHLDVELRTALANEAAGVELSVRSSDFKEGIRAFMDKRPAEFKGN